jgi:CheY-like chemotaxis protein
MHQRIDDAMRSLTDMLDSLLNMTKIESAQLTPHVETVPLHELLASLQSEMTPLASQRGLTLDIDCGALGVKTDKALCRQIFQNLLGNAIKYTDRGGVSVICREKGDRIQVLVRDTGVGIPPNALNAVFGEFQQLASSEGRARGGVGLGLWIVKRLADRLGIKVDVSSELGRGTTFTLDLPHAELPTTMLAAPASKLEHRPPSQQKQILLVEDDAAVRSSTILFLKVEGYGVIGVATLAEAYSAIEARAEGFDLIISDFHLAAGELGVDAIEFARRHYGRTLPAIVLSGDTSKAVAEFKSGSGTMFLDKPVDVDRLLRAIDKSLGLL